MKKLLLVFAALYLFSCSYFQEPEIRRDSSAILNAHGQDFMDFVKTNPQWEADWATISELGTPLPNEAIGMGCIPGGSWYILPLVKDNEIVAFAFYPVENDAARGAGTAVCPPDVVTKDDMAENQLALSFLRSSPFRALKEKGYTLSKLDIPEARPSVLRAPEQSRASSGVYICYEMVHDFRITVYMWNLNDYSPFLSECYNILKRDRPISPYKVDFCFGTDALHINNEALKLTTTAMSIGIATSESEHETAADYYFDWVYDKIEAISYYYSISWVIVTPLFCTIVRDGIVDDGSGGGGSDPVAPKAKTIFRNSNMSEENWEAIERMLGQITDDCMGGMLYSGLVNALNGGTLAIEFGAVSSFDFASGRITIDINKSQSNILFHEMFHAYQSYQETPSSVMSSFVNQEVEARVAQYMYLSKLPEFKPGSEWDDRYTKTTVGKATKALARQLTSKGQFNSSQNITIFNAETCVARELKKDPAYTLYPFDYGRSTSENLKNIQNLAKNC